MRKRRTREHIIADLSVNHIERFILCAGHTAERVYHDYGYDLIVFTYSENGEVESDFIAIQLKATESPRFVESGKEVALTIERRDWDFWLDEKAPVILVLFDAKNDVGYWVHVQASTFISRSDAGQTLTVRFGNEQHVSEDALMEWRRIKNAKRTL